MRPEQAGAWIPALGQRLRRIAAAVLARKLPLADPLTIERRATASAPPQAGPPHPYANQRGGAVASDLGPIRLRNSHTGTAVRPPMTPAR